MGNGRWGTADEDDRGRRQIATAVGDGRWRRQMETDGDDSWGRQNGENEY